MWLDHHHVLQQQQQQQLQSLSARPAEGASAEPAVSSLPSMGPDAGLRTLLQQQPRHQTLPRHRTLPSSDASIMQAGDLSSVSHATIKQQHSWPDQGHLGPQPMSNQLLAPAPAVVSTAQQILDRPQPSIASQLSTNGSNAAQPSRADRRQTAPTDVQLADAFAYLQELAVEVVACRRILQSSFVLGFYCQGSSEQQRSALP